MAQNISVPDIGDFKDVEVIEVLVKPGDKVNKNDPIVTIEIDKSSLEIQSPSSGKIKNIKVKTNLDDEPENIDDVVINKKGVFRKFFISRGDYKFLEESINKSIDII